MTSRRETAPGYRLARGAWALAAAALAVSGLAVPARATEDQMHVIGHFPIVPPKDAAEELLNGSLVLNPPTRHGFQIFVLTSNETLVRILDLDTLATIGEVQVPVQIIPRAFLSAPGEFLTTVDAERDRLYFVFVRQSLWEGVAMVDAKTRTYQILERSDAIDPTRNVDVDNKQVCTAQACQPQLAGARAQPIAMDYVSPYLTGLTPKILMIWQEVNCPACETNSNVAWLAQWDADTGRQDWFTPIRSCTQKNLPTTNASQYSLTVFQARVGSGIYLGCNASGATGQVVRLNVDATNRPTAEETFPGPTNVADVLADPDDDRVLMRVVNEEGESYWVFNGIGSSYSGVVGVTLEPAATAAGIDPSSGRLYVMSPLTSAFGQVNPGGLVISDIRRNPAPQGLQFTKFSQPGLNRMVVDDQAPHDTRRLFFRAIGERSNEWLIIQDDVAITTDPPLTDLDRFTTDVEEQPGVTDRNFTATGHAYGLRYNFTGGIEGIPPGGPDASGIRVGRFVPRWVGSPCLGTDRRLSLASVQQGQLSNNITSAAATAGEVDPGTGIDVGEPTARCYAHPRPNDSDPFPLVFGDDYPRPLDQNSDAEDPDEWRERKDAAERPERDARSDSDELAGNDWPFGVAQCSSENEGHSSTSTQPADRDVDVANETFEPEENLPPEARRTRVDLGGYRADATCHLSKGIVTSSADAVAFEHTIPGSGTIRAGDIAASTKLYLDRKRGLVAHTEATVRDINIFDRIFIDKAFTVAEAWAAGRPGSASSSFLRRLCGVRIPEVKVHADYVDLDFPSQHVHVPGVGVDTPLGRQGTNDIDQDLDPVDENTDDVEINGIDAEGCGDFPVAVQQNPTGIGQQVVIDAINRVLGTRGRATAPQPDTELRQGTPGGYLASVQKDRLQQISARSVNNDESSQVPALEIVIFNDDPTKGRGRQLYQFAGVDASVTYGIFLLNPGGPSQPIPIPPFDAGPIDTEVLGITQARDAGSGSPPAAPRGPIRIIYTGVLFLLRKPRDAILAAAVWGILFSPVQLAMKRRALKAMVRSG